MKSILVCGLPRCGSTLTMRMLAAGGLPTIGTEPDYEDDCMLWGRVSVATLDAIEGKAAKLLEPQRVTARIFDPDRVCVIFLRRDAVQQAASHIKMLRWAGRRVDDSRRARRLMEASLRSDTARATAMLRRSGCQSLVMPFEYLVSAPHQAAHYLAAFASPIATLDESAMAGVVVPRPVTCLPGMLEDHQLAVRAWHAMHPAPPVPDTVEVINAAA